MEKIIRKLQVGEDTETEDYAEYRHLTGNERLQILLELIMPKNPGAAAIERSVRVHPITEHEEC